MQLLQEPQKALNNIFQISVEVQIGVFVIVSSKVEISILVPLPTPIILVQSLSQEKMWLVSINTAIFPLNIQQLYHSSSTVFDFKRHASDYTLLLRLLFHHALHK